MQSLDHGVELRLESGIAYIVKSNVIILLKKSFFQQKHLQSFYRVDVEMRTIRTIHPDVAPGKFSCFGTLARNWQPLLALSPIPF